MAYAYILDAIERERLLINQRQRRAVIRASSNPFEIPNREFQNHYRLSVPLFESLCSELEPYMKHGSRISSISIEHKVMAALSFYATGSYHKLVGKDHQVALSQAAISNCLAEVTDALNNREMLLRHIHFPNTREERRNIMSRFMEIHQFPGVVGCIDGTHISIIRPTDHEEVFFNRKRYHSLNALVICDADLNMLHVDASFGGASHDSFIWNQSVISSYLQSLHDEGEICWLLGDSGYAQNPWLMTPILGATPGSPEDYYTQLHCSTRNTVERCIGVLKARWHCLLAHRTLHYNPLKQEKYLTPVLYYIICATKLDLMCLSSMKLIARGI